MGGVMTREQAYLRAITENPGINTGEIWTRVYKQAGYGERDDWENPLDRLKSMEQRGLVMSVGKGKGVVRKWFISSDKVPIYAA